MTPPVPRRSDGSSSLLVLAAYNVILLAVLGVIAWAAAPQRSWADVTISLPGPEWLSRLAVGGLFWLACWRFLGRAGLRKVRLVLVAVVAWWALGPWSASDTSPTIPRPHLGETAAARGVAPKADDGARQPHHTLSSTSQRIFSVRPSRRPHRLANGMDRFGGPLGCTKRIASRRAPT